jgi:two-component system sensor histidine kinase UhpB
VSELTGIPSHEYLGKTNEELGMPDDLCRLWNENLFMVIETHSPRTFEFRFTGQDGVERSFQSNVSPEIDSDGAVRTVVSIVRDVTDLKRMQTELERSQSELRRLAVRLGEVEEAERKRIARSLHDDLGQHLTALGINLNIMVSILPKKTAAMVMPHITDSLRLIRITMNQVRHLIADLRNPILEDYGLLTALEWYCKEFVGRAGITVAFSENCFGGRLEAVKERELFRIAQESLTNVVRHACATEVRIALQKDNDMIRLSIEDNGTGLFPEKGLDKNNGPVLQHWGLVTMRERAASLGGRMEVESVPTKGTKVVTEVPN